MEDFLEEGPFELGERSSQRGQQEQSAEVVLGMMNRR